MSRLTRKFIKILPPLAIVLTLALGFGGALPASANSAQTSWSGLSSSGALVTDEQCPVVVEEENLTFNLQNFPSNHYNTYEDFIAYDGTVTAEYHLFNPADYEVTVNLAFPFGKTPDYYYDYGYEESLPDPAASDTYTITVNGDKVERTLRHTYSYAYSDYDNETDKARLRDGYMSEGLFDPQTPVTVYCYVVSVEGGEYYHYENAVSPFPQFDNQKTALMLSVNGMDGRNKVFSNSCRDGEAFCVYAIGEPIDPMVWSMEGGSCTLTEQYTTTLSELALSVYDEATGISQIDWFNAVCDSILESRRNVVDGFVYYERGSFNMSVENIMRWYTYSVTIPAGGRATNCVTAPIYPAINTSGTPYYTYTYLLSPATDWAQFSNLNIKINTPYFLCDNTLGDFEKGEDGYTLSLAELPDGELAFILSASDIDVRLYRGSTFIPYKNLGVWIVVGLLAAAAVGVAVFFLVRHIKKRRRSAPHI